MRNLTMTAISIEAAASLIEQATSTEVLQVGGMAATRTVGPAGTNVIVQGSGEEFLLLS